MMITTPEQFAQANKAAFETMQTLVIKSVEGFEKLADLNIQAAKSSLTESTEQVKSMIAAKDPKAVADLLMGSAQPAADKATAYAKHVYGIAAETGTEMSKLFEEQIAEGQKQLGTAIEAMTKNAPAGTEGMVAMFKNMMSMANSTYEQVSKTAKQAAETVEANITAAAKAAPRSVRKAA